MSRFNPIIKLWRHWRQMTGAGAISPLGSAITSVMHRNKFNNLVYVTKWVACGWSLCRIGMPRRVPDFNPIKFFQPSVTNWQCLYVLKQGQTNMRKIVGIKRAYIIKPVPQSISRCLTHPTNMGGAVSSTCYNEESGLFPCLYPSHPRLWDEDARSQTFGANWPHHHPNLLPSEMSKAGFFWLCQGDRVKCYYCDDGLSRWKTDDDVSLSMRSGFHIVNTYRNRKDSLLYLKPPPGWQTSIDHSHANWNNLCLPVFFWEGKCHLEERLLSPLLSSNDNLLCSQNDNTWNKNDTVILILLQSRVKLTNCKMLRSLR